MPYDFSPLVTPDDLHFFNEGRHSRLYEKLGAHILPGDQGVHFAVWAPNARAVSVIGDFNGWDKNAHPLNPAGHSGLWIGTARAARAGQCYKYHIKSHHHGYAVDKADPFAFRSEEPPRTGSVIGTLDYQWQDEAWLGQRAHAQALDQPLSIYELHLGSWRRKPEDDNRPLSYRELADELPDYLTKAGFTHVEFMPVMEHPFGGSWGYQVTGFFAPTSRYGTPQDFMYLIDSLHRAGIGVILDWVPSHFPGDEHGLAYFDGTHLYEHQDPKQGFHPDWNSYIFNYGRDEVRSFLISSAMFWFDKYHIDGLRVDAVASMIYLDYSRNEGEWVPNRYGGRENLEALQFLRDMNNTVHESFPGIMMIAEESTDWPMVSRPPYMGGLGFNLKWDMGWMHDTLKYFSHDPVHRPYHQNELTFRAIYAYHENFVLSLSHDEVVHGKRALLCKMPGDDWQKFANLRCLYSYMYAMPGKKLLFMGGEIGQWDEWNHDGTLDWHLLDYDRHQQIFDLVARLNRVYCDEKALQLDCDPAGFFWIDASDVMHSVLCFARRNDDACVLCLFNFTPVPRENYKIGAPHEGAWEVLVNSDDERYGGSGLGTQQTLHTISEPCHGQPCSLNLNLPPLGALILKWKK